MKTSTKLLLLAVIILFGTTAAYDFALRENYLMYYYNKPFREYTKLEFKDFDTIEIVASNVLNTEIIRSDTFDVRLHNWLSGAKITQKGKRLIINCETEKYNYQDGNSKPALLIKCPALKEVKTDARIFLNGRQQILKSILPSDVTGGKVVIRGFKQDKFSLVMNNASTVYLKGNSFKFLYANIGIHVSSRSSINIDYSNSIESADIDLQNNSVMSLNNIYIKNFKYKLSDSTQVSLNGISLRLLSNKNK